MHAGGVGRVSFGGAVGAPVIGPPCLATRRSAAHAPKQPVPGTAACSTILSSGCLGDSLHSRGLLAEWPPPPCQAAAAPQRTQRQALAWSLVSPASEAPPAAPCHYRMSRAIYFRKLRPIFTSACKYCDPTVNYGPPEAPACPSCAGSGTRTAGMGHSTSLWTISERTRHVLRTGCAPMPAGLPPTRGWPAPPVESVHSRCPAQPAKHVALGAHELHTAGGKCHRRRACSGLPAGRQPSNKGADSRVLRIAVRAADWEASPGLKAGGPEIQ